MLDLNDLILITGTSGMVGSAMERYFCQHGYKRLLTPRRKEMDLSDAGQVTHYMEKHRPDYVFMIGAKVGGIAANSADPFGFLSENVRMQINMFDACLKFRPKKILFFGSSCIYPRDCPQPMKEEYLLTGPLEPTNEGYALAKIAGLKLAQYCHQQHQLLSICPMPCNIYGTNDHFDFQRSHVLSALVRRFVDAQDSNAPDVTLWGTGSALREFIHVDDVADAIFFLMKNYHSPEIINVGTGQETSIRDLALLISRQVGYRGELKFDTSKPDGMPRKCLDTSRISKLGWKPRISLEEGVAKTVSEYRSLKKQNIQA